METWVIVGLALAAAMIVFFRNCIFFEAVFIGLIAGLTVEAAETIAAGWLSEDGMRFLWLVLAIPVIFFFISFFRYLPRKIFSCFWLAPTFALTYSLFLRLVGIMENLLTAFILFFSLSVAIMVLMAGFAGLIVLAGLSVRCLQNSYIKSMEQGMRGTEEYKP